MKVLLTSAAALLIAAALSSAHAGPYQTGYGGGQWGGIDGTGIEAKRGSNGVYDRPGMCSHCNEIDYEYPHSVRVTTNSSSSGISIGANGPVPNGGFSYNSSSTSTTTEYGRRDYGLNADGGSCPCSRADK